MNMTYDATNDEDIKLRVNVQLLKNRSQSPVLV
jgi:hypothetical protein